jgi:hypothetical protein
MVRRRTDSEAQRAAYQLGALRTKSRLVVTGEAAVAKPQWRRRRDLLLTRVRGLSAKRTKHSRHFRVRYATQHRFTRFGNQHEPRLAAFCFFVYAHQLLIAINA